MKNIVFNVYPPRKTRRISNKSIPHFISPPPLLVLILSLILHLTIQIKWSNGRRRLSVPTHMLIGPATAHAPVPEKSRQSKVGSRSSFPIRFPPTCCSATKATPNIRHHVNFLNAVNDFIRIFDICHATVLCFLLVVPLLLCCCSTRVSKVFQKSIRNW